MNAASEWLAPKYRDALMRAGLNSISAWMALRGEVVRHVPPRLTRRVEIALEENPTKPLCVYVKHHSPESYWSWIRALLHGQRPVFGARPEYLAAVAFAELGIPSIRPVAFLESNGESLLVTESLNATIDLKTVSQQPGSYFANRNDLARWIRDITGIVAEITRRMHSAGWHHQDYYLNHMLWTPDNPGNAPYVIDLGRARHHAKLSNRWIIKDLAQLEYSAAAVDIKARLRFLKLYLGRKLRRSDRRMIAAISAKASRIARHSKRHDL